MLTYTVIEADDFEDLPAWMRAEMARTQMRVDDVARALGVSKSAVSQWRNGRRRIGVDTLLRLTRLFGYRVELRRMYEVAHV